MIRSKVPHGALQRLPYVKTAPEILEMRFWAHHHLQEKRNLPDPIKRAKNLTSRIINHQLGNLSSMTRKTALGFPALEDLHPFERDLIQLTLDEGVYESQIHSLLRIYAKLHNLGREYEKKAVEMTTKKDTFEVQDECTEALKLVIKEDAHILKTAATMAKELRALPTISLDKPIFAFVGAPNVGKSSLVRLLSNAKAEVANYPFTTRGITMGHVFINEESYQIADTPGLLFRDDAKRNKIEKLALSILCNTPSAVGFVLDPSGVSGTSMADQIQLRNELRSKLPEKAQNAWIDIVSKADLPSQAIECEHELMAPMIHVSSETKLGLRTLNRELRSLLTSLDTK